MTPLTEGIAVVADTIREIYRNDPELAEAAIEARLSGYCIDMTEGEKTTFIGSLAKEFKVIGRNADTCWESDEKVLKEVFSLLFGRDMPAGTVSAQEMLERLSLSMDTLFGTLNRIVKTINATLLENIASDQTIRHVIGSHMEGDKGIKPLEEYLDRIEKAFLVSHQAFKQAAHTIVRRLIKEIQPEDISADAGKGFKFGPLRKAECFDLYQSKYDILVKWFESGRFMNDLLREFENSCQASV